MRLIDADAMLERLQELNTSDDMDKALYRFTFDRIMEQPTACTQTEEIKWVSVEDRLPSDGDSRFYMCLVENHLEDPPMCCQYEEEYGFGFWNDIYDPVTLGFVDSEFQTMEELHYEKVCYWMPLIEPPKDEEEGGERCEAN